MKIKETLGIIDPTTFITAYLSAKNINSVPLYLVPNRSCLDNHWDYPNMEQAVEAFLKKAVDNYDADGFKMDKKVGVLVDCDTDGVMSGTLMANYLMLRGFMVQPFIHVGKQHGLTKSKDEDIVKQVLEANLDFLIIPDAGSNDVEQCKELTEHGVDIIILDHHPIEQDNPYAIVVNPHLGVGLNTDISGTGVVWHFIQALNEKNGGDIEMGDIMVSEMYGLDQVAISIVSDVCNLTPFENRYFVYNGLRHFTNPLIKLMYEKLSKSDYTPHGIGWNIAPVINALCRCGTMEEKKIFIRALCGWEEASEGLKVARRCHRRQTEETKRIMGDIEPTIDNSHKAIVCFGENEDANFLGLCANKILSKYNKPTFILREINATSYTGSLRSPFPISEEINKSGIAKAMGHSEAAGIVVTKKKLEKFISWLDEMDWDIDPEIEVVGEVSPKAVTLDLCEAVSGYNELWGHGLEEPKFYIKITLPPDSVQVFRKTTNTVKYSNGKVDFLKFRASEDDIEKFTKGGELEMVVSLSVNEWNGVKTPNAIIESYEITEDDKWCDEDWMVDF